MSTTAAQYQFAAEFVTMVVASAGLVLVALRGPATSSSGVARAALGLGFAVIGTMAFLHGAYVVGPGADRALGAGRAGGAAVLLVGSHRWAGSVASRALLWVGSLLGIVAAALEIRHMSSGACDTALIVASAALAAALVGAARRSVAARLATAAAATVLLVVLVLSVALGSVITSSVQRDELAGVTSQARIEAGQVAGLATAAVRDARFVAVDLAGYFRGTSPDPLIAAAAGPSPAADAALGQRLLQVIQQYPVGGLAYADAAGGVVAATPGLRVAQVGSALAPVLAGRGCSGDGQGGLVVSAGEAWVVAAYPECLASDHRLLGAVVSLAPVDAAYLAARSVVDPGPSLAVATPTAVLATAGGQPPAGTLERLAADGLGHGSLTRALAGRLVSAQPLRDASGRAVAAVVLSLPGTALVTARDNLFRTLSLIALGGTALALLLSALIGDRVTAGIRSLTGAAQRVQAGDTATRAGIGSNDEVGVLGAAFDSMLVAIEGQTHALRGAADDETRLRNRLEAVVAGMGEALVAVDASGRLTDFNRAAERLTGLRGADVLATPAAQCLGLLDGDGRPLPALRGRAGPDRLLLATLHLATGPPIPLAVSSGALRGPAGEPVGAVLVLRDLRREQELERMKTEFLSRVGHELRTPLTGILGYADMLVRRPVAPERAAGWHEEIRRSARRLMRIVEMLEFFASSGAGRVPLRPEAVAVRGLLGAGTVHPGPGGADRVEVVRRVARGTPPVMVDPRWVTMAVDELVDNAVKFSPAGSRVRVTARPVPGGPPHPAVVIEVSDRGKGMTPEERAVAFGEFSQGDASDTRAYGGLGLGLALVRQVVELHGGTVTCASVPGGGSRFTITVPAAAPR